MADWTPMTEKKPNKDGRYWVTWKNSYVECLAVIDGEFYNFGMTKKETDTKLIVAWQPIDMPEPYEPPMTEAEALSVITKIEAFYAPESNFSKACKVAEEALEKRIPKRISDNYEYSYYCPECEKEVVYEAAYCHFCGQALEWED